MIDEMKLRERKRKWNYKIARQTCGKSIHFFFSLLPDNHTLLRQSEERFGGIGLEYLYTYTAPITLSVDKFWWLHLLFVVLDTCQVIWILNFSHYMLFYFQRIIKTKSSKPQILSFMVMCIILIDMEVPVGVQWCLHFKTTCSARIMWS